MISVDAFDLKMLAALQDDGRLTNQQLAELVGLSASQCSRRRMRLEQEKVIAGYHADLAGEALGFNLIAFIHITLRQCQEIPRAGQPRRRYPGSLFAHRRRRLPAEGRAARPQGPVRYRQQRADAAPKRGACAVVDRAGPAQGELEAAVEEIGWHCPVWRKSREIRHSPFSFELRWFPANYCTEPPWPCNYARTRTCRRTRSKHGSAPTNARSARTVSRTDCTMSARTAAAGLRRARSGQRPRGGPASASTSSRHRISACT